MSHRPYNKQEEERNHNNGTGMSSITEVVGVGTEERTMSPGVAVHAVLVLWARRSEMPDLVTSVAVRPGLKVLGAIGMNVSHVTCSCNVYR